MGNQVSAKGGSGVPYGPCASSGGWGSWQAMQVGLVQCLVPSICPSAPCCVSSWLGHGGVLKLGECVVLELMYMCTQACLAPLQLLCAVG